MITACMTTTISVDDATLARFRELKAELDARQDDVPAHTADSFLSAVLDTWEAAGREYYTSDDTLAAETDVTERLDRNYEAIKEATDAAQAAEQAVDEVTQR